MHGKRLVHRAGPRSRGIGNQGQAQLEGGSAAFGCCTLRRRRRRWARLAESGQAEAQAMSAGLGGEEGFEQVERAAGGILGCCRARAGRSGSSSRRPSSRAGGRPARLMASEGVGQRLTRICSRRVWSMPRRTSSKMPVQGRRVLAPGARVGSAALRPPPARLAWLPWSLCRAKHAGWR